MYKLSAKSLAKLEKVKTPLYKVVSLAIKYTNVDFGVIDGLRTIKRQEKLVKSGVSQTIKSKHLTGDAVDLVAYIDGRVCWELEPYFEVFKSIKKAAEELNVNIKWGGCWRSLSSISDPKEAVSSYIEKRVKQGRKYFIDAPHFELT